MEEYLIWNEFGNIHLNVASYDEAIQAYSKAIDLAPNFGWPYRNLASAYLATGRFADAVPLLQKSINLLHSNAEKAISFNKLGEAFRQLGDYQQALEAYQQADALSSSHTQEDRPFSADDSRADSLPPQDATKASDTPQDAEVYGMQAAASPDQTNVVMEEAPSQPEPIASHEENYSISSAAPSNACPETEQTTEPNLSNQEIKSAFEWNGLGNAHLKAGAYDDAITAYTKAIETAQDVYWPYIHNLALAHYQKGRYTKVARTSFQSESVDLGEVEPISKQKEERSIPWRLTSQSMHSKQPTRNPKNRPNPNYLLARARFLLASNSRG